VARNFVHIRHDVVHTALAQVGVVELSMQAEIIGILGNALLEVCGLCASHGRARGCDTPCSRVLVLRVYLECHVEQSQGVGVLTLLLGFPARVHQARDGILSRVGQAHVHRVDAPRAHEVVHGFAVALGLDQ
jgi:hypothetical protein